METMVQRQRQALNRQNAFISSTQMDLAEHRRQVINTLLSLGIFPIAMEQFVPDGTGASSVSLDRLAEAQLYIGIIGWRYGNIPPGETHSVTHLEYLEARRRGLPCYLFLADPATEEDFALFPPEVRDADHHDALMAFRSQIGADLVVKFFTTPQDLALKVSETLFNIAVKTKTGKPRAIPRERKVVLDRVQSFWISGMLERSLENAMFIPLGLYERPDMIKNPMIDVQQEADRPQRLLPSGTTIKQVFEESEETLLILGEPGAGKTTLLLQLAKDLIQDAALDESLPLPVVFNLSTWATKSLPIADWMIDELISKYQLPRNLARSLVEQSRILPLLDGLDEVGEDQRNACVVAINAFHQDQHYRLVPLIIGSRLAEYQVLATKIVGERAVQVQPMTVQQVQSYLKSMPGGQAALEVLPLDDPEFQEIAQNPLMLHTLMAAYQGKTVRFDRSLPLEDQKRQIFADYVEHMLERGQKEKHYTPEQTKNWLLWLAQKMQVRDQSTFYLERIQMDWLAKTLPYKLYFALVFGFVSFLFTFTANSIFFQSVFSGLTVGLVDAGLALLFGLLSINGAFNKPEEPSSSTYLAQPKRRVSIARLFRAFSWKLAVVAIIFGAIDFLAVRTATTAAYANSHGLLVAVYFGIAGIFDNEIRPAELLVWSWASVRRHALASMAQGMGFGTLLGLYNAVQYGHTPQVFLSTLAFGMSEGFVFGILLMLLRGYSRNVLDATKVIKPNQGIRNSLSNSFRLGLFAGLSTGPIVFFFYSYYIHHVFITGFVNAIPADVDVIYGSVLALALAYLFWLVNGGFAVLQHYVLRYTLWRHHNIPWRYVTFLDFANRRILLRKIGGGYAFIHKLLLEYFAGLDGDKGSHAQPTS
jgi:Cdc6-like AAA superfamily ATPase